MTIELDMTGKSHPPEAENVILIDFDDTIQPWGRMFQYTPPYEGVADFTQRLKAQGYTIGIFTSRLSDLWLKAIGHTAAMHIDYITQYGERFGIPFDFITAEKVPAIAYIDDKAITFKYDWADIGKQFESRGWLVQTP
jgi:hypothetical protein